MIASTPHVAVAVPAPGDDRERAGRPWRSATGRLGPDAHVEHAAGAERDLGHARPDAALPDERRLLVADQGGDRRRAVERTGDADDRRSSRRWRAGPARGMRRASSTLASQPCAPRRRSPVTAGVGRVGDVKTSPSGEVPRHPGVDRADAQVAACDRGRPRRAGGRPWSPIRSGANRSPSPCQTRQSPTVRRSCQPRPGPTGSPVARSQATVEARWLVTPTAATGPPSASAARATSRAASASVDRVELDEARARGRTAGPVGGGRR